MYNILKSINVIIALRLLYSIRSINRLIERIEYRNLRAIITFVDFTKIFAMLEYVIDLTELNHFDYVGD